MLNYWKKSITWDLNFSSYFFCSLSGCNLRHHNLLSFMFLILMFLCSSLLSLSPFKSSHNVQFSIWETSRSYCLISNQIDDTHLTNAANENSVLRVRDSPMIIKPTAKQYSSSPLLPTASRETKEQNTHS